MPGAYEYVLQRRCELEAEMAMQADLSIPSVLEDDYDEAVWEREKAARVAALMDERRGQPLRVQSWQLPPGLPPPFEHWPRGGGRRSFIVTPDDQIELRTMRLRSA
ncbi:hypothetical protein A5640_11130 [Mycobacterium asiaticum]|uniref:Uncharacterized protein n=1 Tax=Mycobacterium asiaticum TaxID=1790 RepID=A0A1A3KNA7_MYCAS|nr:hypothetical protein A5640_11130 [Mycobacterium asiaticum]